MTNWEFALRVSTASLVAAWLLVLAVDRWGEPATLFVLAFNAVPTLLAMYPWKATSLLRFLRLVCGAAAATAGALFMLALENAGDQSSEANGSWAAVLGVALLSGVAGTWAADLTVARRADEEAECRHVELLERVAAVGAPPSPARPGRLRVRDAILLAVAARLVRR